MYPYPDLNEFYTLKDNCYAVIPVTHKDFEFETDSRLDERERELLEKDIITSFLGFNETPAHIFTEHST